MSALLETAVTALALSALAVACLALLPNAPPRVRFGACVAGLAAWLVPWAWIRIPLAPRSLAAPLRESIASFEMLRGTLAADATPDTAAVAGYLAAAAFLAGLALFAADWMALRRCVRRWHAASAPADELRAELPPELRDVPAEIRVVRDSRVAAASGWIRPTVWIGDGYTGASRKLVLTHEMWHAHRHDPAWLALIAAVRRAYWWNPLVGYLAREAVLMLESSCDLRCATALGKQSYVTGLATLMLEDAAPSPRLIAAVRSASFNVARLRLLGASRWLRARDVALLVALATMEIGRAHV